MDWGEVRDSVLYILSVASDFMFSREKMRERVFGGRMGYLLFWSSLFISFAVLSKNSQILIILLQRYLSKEQSSNIIVYKVRSFI